MPVDALEERRRGFYLKTDINLADSVLKNLPLLNQQAALDWCSPLTKAVADVLKTNVKGLKPLKEQGTFHFLHEATLETGDNVIVRSSSPHVFASDSSLYLDAWAHTHLEEVGLPALNCYHVDTSLKTLPFAWMIMAAARGQSIANLPDHEIDAPSILQNMGAALNKLHKIKGQGYGPIDSQELSETKSLKGIYKKWDDYIFCCLDQHLKEAVRLDFLNLKEYQNTLSWMAQNRALIGKAPEAFLHGDPGNHNFFIEKNVLSAILDWEDALLGDPLYEMAFWATFHPERRWDAFFSGYGLSPYDAPETSLRFALYFFRITLAKILHRYRFGYTGLPHRPSSRQRLLGALKLIEAAQKRATS